MLLSLRCLFVTTTSIIKNLLNNYNTTISFQYLLNSTVLSFCVHFLNYITPTTAVLFAAALKSPPLPPTIFLLIRKTCKPNFAVVYLCYIIYVCMCVPISIFAFIHQKSPLSRSRQTLTDVHHTNISWCLLLG